MNGRDVVGFGFRLLPRTIRERLAGGAQASHGKELLRGSLLSLLLKVGGVLCGYGFTLLVANVYGAHAMGVFTLFVTVLNIASVVGRLGFDTAILKFTAEYAAQGRVDLAREVFRKSVGLVVPVCLSLSALLYLFAPALAQGVFGKAYLAVPFRLAAFAVLPFSMLVLVAEGLRGLKRIRDYSFLQDMSLPLVGTVVLALSLPFLRSEFAPVAAHLAATVTACGFALVLWARAMPSAPARAATIRLGTILQVSLPMLVSASLYVFMGWADKIILGIYAPEREVGIYNVALKISSLTSLTLFAVNSIAAPKFAQCHGAGDAEGLRRIAQQATAVIFWSAAPVLLVFLLFPRPILGLFGPEFRAGASALRLLALGQFVNAATGSVGYLLQMTGRQRVFQHVMVAAVVVNLAANLLLVPRYGMNGAAFAGMIGVAMLNVIPFFLIRRHFGFVTFSPAVVFFLKKRGG